MYYNMLMYYYCNTQLLNELCSLHHSTVASEPAGCSKTGACTLTPQSWPDVYLPTFPLHPM